MPHSKPKQHIALFLGQELSLHNQARAGIVRYARPNHPWQFAHLSRRLSDLQRLKYDRWDGGIANFTDRRKIATVRRFGIPIVNIYGGRASWGVAQVGVDNQAIGTLAAEYFLGKGFTHLAFYGLAGSGYSIGRWTGFRNTARQQGCRPARFVYRDATEIEKGVPHAKRLSSWIERLPKPVAILACDGLRGLWLCELCQSLGIVIPDDVAIVCVSSDDLVCEGSFPPLTSISMLDEECGYLAAEMLDRLLHHQPIRTPLLLAPGPIVERRSSDIQHIGDQAVARALARIRHGIRQGLRVSAIAKDSGVCRRVLERRFRRALGRSIHQEIRRVQIEEAKRQLTRTDATLETIAPLAGFSSGIQLSHEFRKSTGQTPGQYRKQARLIRN